MQVRVCPFSCPVFSVIFCLFVFPSLVAFDLPSGPEEQEQANVLVALVVLSHGTAGRTVLET